MNNYFLLVFDRIITPNSAPLRDACLHDKSGLDFDLSKSLKVKSDSAAGQLDNYSRKVFNSKMWPNFIICVYNVEFDLLRSLNRSPIYWCGGTLHTLFPVSI